VQTTTRNHVRRGARGTFYLRRRIPRHLLSSFLDGRREIVVSLRTTDRRIAERRFHAEQLKTEAVLASHQAQLEEQLRAQQALRHQAPAAPTPEFVTDTLVDMALRGDDYWRFLGFDDEQFEQYATLITTQRDELGKLAARGRIDPLMPALQALLQEFGHDIPNEHKVVSDISAATPRTWMDRRRTLRACLRPAWCPDPKRSGALKVTTL